MKRWPWIGAAVGLGIVIGCGGSGGGSGDGGFALAQSRVNILGNAMLVYTGDSDDVFPYPDIWMDAITPYVPAGTSFRSPAVEGEDRYGFAFNSAMATQTANDFPDSTVMIFDSTVLTRNATASLDTRPSPGRYDGRNAEVTIAGAIEPEPDLTPLEISISRTKHNSTALLMYEGDNNDVLPPTGIWMDALLPYEKTERNYRTPFFDGTLQYGYALNTEVVGRSAVSFDNPVTTIAVFDSIATARNVDSPAAARPTPGRYNGQNAVGYLDGHVEAKSP